MALPITNPQYYPKFTNGTYAVPNYNSDPFLNGYQITLGPSSVWLQGGTQFSVSPGAARAYSTEFVISYNPFVTPNIPTNIAVDLNVTGPGGCFPTPFSFLNFNGEAEPFAVYVIGDSSAVNGNKTSVIVATGNNFLPAGYDSWRRIGTILIYGPGRQMVQYTQIGSGLDREYILLQSIGLTTYGATSFFPIPFGTVGSNPFGSPLVKRLFYQYELKPANLTDYALISSFNFAGNQALMPCIIASTSISASNSDLSTAMWVPMGQDANGRNIQYVLVSGAGAQFIPKQCGWMESMGLEVL